MQMRSMAILWCGGVLALAGCGSPTRIEEHAAIDERAGANIAAAAMPALIGRTDDNRNVSTPSDETFPAEVIAFRTRRDTCDHVRGEDGYDEARTAFLVREAKRNCTGTDAALRALRQRYATRPAVIAALSTYEDAVE
jgi:hypothetical protein